jgi:hypothetical protein
MAWRGGRSSEAFRLNSEPIIRPVAPDRGEPTLNLTGWTAPAPGIYVPKYGRC